VIWSFNVNKIFMERNNVFSDFDRTIFKDDESSFRDLYE